MLKHRHTLALVLALGAAPLAAQAVGVEHFAPNELGVAYHPEHSGPRVSSDQVSAELEAAQKQPNWDAVNRYGAPPAQTARREPLSRAQVEAELAAMQRSPAWERASRLGAPLPVSAPTGTAAAPR